MTHRCVMNKTARPLSLRCPVSRPAFSLVELLVVVGIIALLIGILLPAMSNARTEAKRSETRQNMAGIERGLEMFNTDFREFPDSTRRKDPIDYGDGAHPYLSGAHWLARAIVGHDGQGVDYGGRSLDSSQSYAIGLFKTDPPPGTFAKRRGMYINKPVYRADNSVGSSNNNPNTGRAVLLDSFEYPLIYYRAKPRASLAVAERTPNTPGVYTQEDNADVTGGKTVDGATPGWELGPQSKVDSLGTVHGLGVYVNPDPGVLQSVNQIIDSRFEPPTYTFTGYLHDANALKNNVVKAVNDTTYILASAGPDGIFGTLDDVTNFK